MSTYRNSIGHRWTSPTWSRLRALPELRRSRGGQTTWDNIVCCCVKCNVRKGGRTPDEAGMTLIKPPVRPKRSPVLSVKLGNPKYESWRMFLNDAYWNVDLK